MNAEIRRLSASDLELLLSLRMEVLGTVFAEEKKELDRAAWAALREENRRYYLAAIDAGEHIACAAYAGGEIAGCGGVCLYREMPSPDNRSGKCAYLMNIYTRAPYRGKGVAKAVCAWLIDQAKTQGAEKIYLETSEGGKRLYRALGFHEMKDYMKLE